MSSSPKDKFLDYLEGMLGEPERSEFEALLAKDSKLRAAFEDYKKLIATEKLLREKSYVLAPRNVAAVMEKLEAQPETWFTWLFALNQKKLIGSLATLATLVVVIKLGLETPKEDLQLERAPATVELTQVATPLEADKQKINLTSDEDIKEELESAAPAEMRPISPAKKASERAANDLPSRSDKTLDQSPRQELPEPPAPASGAGSQKGVGSATVIKPQPVDQTAERALESKTGRAKAVSKHDDAEASMQTESSAEIGAMKLEKRSLTEGLADQALGGEIRETEETSESFRFVALVSAQRQNLEAGSRIDVFLKNWGSESESLVVAGLSLVYELRAGSDGLQEIVVELTPKQRQLIKHAQTRGSLLVKPAN